jgi:hypothetical protein
VVPMLMVMRMVIVGVDVHGSVVVSMKSTHDEIDS